MQTSNDYKFKTDNYQACLDLQYMFEPDLLNIVAQNRLLIKQGPIYKVAKRNGQLLLRHLALVGFLIWFFNFFFFLTEIFGFHNRTFSFSLLT